MNSMPRTLDELLTEIGDPDLSDIDKCISGNMWSKQFQTYLRKRKLDDDENILKFLILSQAFKNREQTLKESNNNTKKKNLRKEQEEIYLKLGEMYFLESSEENIPLSNGTVFNSITETTQKLQKGGKISDSDVENLFKAMEDSSVKDEGLDPTFKKFLTQASPSTIACLLSIL